MKILTAPWALAFSLGLISVIGSLASAQDQAFEQDLIGGKSFPSLSGTFGVPSDNQEKVSFSAFYELEKGTDVGRVTVTAQIIPRHHIYSTTQAEGGPLPTKIELVSDHVELAGPFLPDSPPKLSKSEYFPVTIEEFSDEVRWTAVIRAKQEFDPEATSVGIKINGQVCLTDGSCQPLRKEIQASFEGFYGGSEAVYELRAENTHALWSATIEPQQVRPGDRAKIVISAVTDPGYHIYRFDPKDDNPSNRTIIVATQKAGLLFGAPTTDQEVITQDLGTDQPFEYHPGSVSWTIPIEIPESAQPGQYPIELLVGFNTCDDRSCDPPAAIRFSGAVNVSDTPDDQPARMALESVGWNAVAGQPSMVGWIDQTASETSLWQRFGGSNLEWWMIGAALLGGFILNFMPCVLPVIGLKLMSFVNQSGSNHGRVVALNLSFVAGILTVLIGLALLNIAFKLTGQAFGWGEQFNRIEFQVALVVLLFAMSLSFLGVWEIPIPGFATSSKSGELMEKEGLLGAFYKGVLTTILATPCSGPFLGTVFGLTLTLSAWSILALFCLVGLGLGLPYLALCFWPGFIKWLPKPGAWMETLKEILAFPLLLTVVYFISVIQPDYRIAALTLLIAVWFGCWLIGRVPAYAERRRLVAGWATAVGLCVVTGIVSFTYLGPSKHHLPWQEYTEAALAENRAKGNVVMIDFTARWCLTCQYNLVAAIDRPAVAKVVEQNRVVPLIADWSDRGDQIADKLRELESNSIPLLAIYPADPGAEPIILRDVITQAQLIEALQKAGPSKGATRLTSQPKYD